MAPSIIFEETSDDMNAANRWVISKAFADGIQSHLYISPLLILYLLE